jgi:hypothetical protein
VLRAKRRASRQPLDKIQVALSFIAELGLELATLVVVDGLTPCSRPMAMSRPTQMVAM